ncbi:MAG: alpha/beta fold hydrolase [Austwickia sp.]|nr:MAG: alpha/beta fold hydrolase [Austwickia sp.]
MRFSRLLTGAAALAGALSLAACGGGTTPAPTAAASSSSASASPTPEPPKDTRPIDERCLRQTGFAPTSWRTPAGSTVSGATLGSGERTLVLLHSTGASGLCEGWPIGKVAAARGMTVVAVDACAWGGSSCLPADAADPRVAVRTVVDQLRARGAKPITVMGSSMGGTVALASATLDGVDAVVDVSGPGGWAGVPDAATSAQAAAERKVPTLLVVADKDEGSIVAGVTSAEKAAPSATAIHAAGDDHGFALLVTSETVASPAASPTGAQVLDWIAAVKPRA